MFLNIFCFYFVNPWSRTPTFCPLACAMHGPLRVRVALHEAKEKANSVTHKRAYDRFLRRAASKKRFRA